MLQRIHKVHTLDKFMYVYIQNIKLFSKFIAEINDYSGNNMAK